ncbi:MAG TPA: hypothetical protein PLN27_17640 [Acidobacteriota bacterium]|nr:hypothetical protein [Acidobacteriota bacterium]HQK89288.1 hypothetical protein [Acidobacteriota bacterium]
MRKMFGVLGLLLMSSLAWAQDVSGTIQGAIDDVTNIASAVGAVVMGIVGVVGLGRAAYKFAHGDTDAVTSLIMGIVALFIGALCATFI